MHADSTNTGLACLRRSPGRAVVLVLLTVACDDGQSLPPLSHLPYRFEPTLAVDPIPYFEDLDGDGRDEFLQVFEPTGRRPSPLTSVLILTHERVEVDQLNYVGFVGRPYALDLDEDGRKEIFVPVVRDDTLHLSVADAAGNKLFGFPLTTGRPRIEPGGELPWDPGILGLHLLDVTGDGRRELVSVISTGYARYPRGVFVHEVPTGILLDSLMLGAALLEESLMDLGGDGPVMILGNLASDNGATSGGFDDRHSYAIAVDLGSPIHVRWFRELGGIRSRVSLHSTDLTVSGGTDLFVVASRETGTRIERVDPSTGAALLSREYPALSSPVVTDLDGDGQAEIVAIEGSSSIVALGPELNLEARVTLPTRVSTLKEWPDLDGDGRRELSVFDNSHRRHVLLGSDLEIKAALPAAGGQDASYLQPFQRGPTRPPLLVIQVAGTYTGFELVRNPWPLVRRFGPPAAAVAGPLLLVLLVGAFFRARKRNRLHESVAVAMLASGSSAAFVLDRRGRIPWTTGNPTHAPQDGPDAEGAPRSVSDLAKRSPALASVCQRLLDSDVLEPVHTRLDPGGEDQSDPLHVAALPLRTGMAGDPHWIVRCGRGLLQLDGDQSRTWVLLARRVAHDIRNPLSGILLTLDRMRATVRDRWPGAEDTMVAYGNRIEERIEQLRRMTGNFLKFIDVDEAARRPADLSDAVRGSMITISQMVPDDIEIRLKLGEDPMPVRLDREQFQSVMENLVGNAVNAMVEGGTLVVRTDLARSLPLLPKAGPRDYGVVEIRDTGSGIPDDVLTRLFEPGFSTTRDGTGLGLAIVKKTVEDHGGRVSVESEEGVGSVFTVHLPLADDRDRPTPQSDT